MWEITTETFSIDSTARENTSKYIIQSIEFYIFSALLQEDKSQEIANPCISPGNVGIYVRERSGVPQAVGICVASSVFRVILARRSLPSPWSWQSRVRLSPVDMVGADCCPFTMAWFPPPIVWNGPNLGYVSAGGATTAGRAVQRRN